MLTPTRNVVRLFYNEKCKGCENAVWVYVKPYYYWTADGVKHRENKAAVCMKYAAELRERCEKGYLIACECECERDDRNHE